MSTMEAESRWVERITDWSNPILVKEVRQSLKSRQFVVTFMLLVTVSWLGSVFGLLMFSTQIQYGSAGRFFFLGFYFALAVATLLIVPFNTFRSLQAERDFNTYEILSVTTITPQQIVRGKLFSSLVQCFIYYSAITPFMAFASTMQGFDAPRAAYFLVATVLISLMLSMAALTLSTLAKQRATQGLLSMMLIGGLVWAISGGSGLVWAFTIERPLPITNPIFWQINAVVVLVFASYFLLFQQIASVHLTFESANHSTGIRLTAGMQFWLLWLVTFGYCRWEGTLADNELFLVFAILSIIHWAAFGLAITAESDSLSRRIRRDFPENKLLRLCMVPFLPGGARGFLFLLIQVVSLWGIYGVSRAFFSLGGWPGRGVVDQVLTAWKSQDRELMVVTALCCHLIIYAGANTALARWGQSISEVIKPAHARVVTFLLLMAAIVGPRILEVSEVIEIRPYHYLQALDPVYTPMYLARHGDFTADTVVWILVTLAAFSVLINLPAIFTNTSRVLNSHVRPRKPSDIKPLADVRGLTIHEITT